MARPKKTPSPLVENFDLTQDNKEHTDTPETVQETKAVALSFYRVAGKSEWKVVKIQFDPTTGYAKPAEVIETCDSENGALNRFKVQVSESILRTRQES